MYIVYTMNFIKKLFGVKATVIEPTAYAPTWKCIEIERHNQSSNYQSYTEI